MHRGGMACRAHAWRHALTLLAACLLLCALCASAADFYQHTHQYGYHGGGAAARAVRLDQVKALTLREGRMTAGRRHAPVPQLKCIGGCEYEQPDVVQCMNVGSDGSDVQWKCEAELPPYLRFGETTVTCEGYDYPEDPRVLEGSCGLEYSLKPVKGAAQGHWQRQRQQRREEAGQSGIGSLIKWLLIVYILYMAFRICFSSSNSSATDPPPPGHSGPWGWGGGGGGWGWPPPPPGPPPPPSYKPGTATAGPSTSTWAAGAAGLGLGYLMGRRSGSTMYRGPSRAHSWRNDSGSSSSGDSGPRETRAAYASTSRR